MPKSAETVSPALQSSRAGPITVALPPRMVILQLLSCSVELNSELRLGMDPPTNLSVYSCADTCLDGYFGMGHVFGQPSVRSRRVQLVP